MLADDRFRDAVAAAVTRAEARTSAEIVVVAAPRSASYRDVALAVGGGVAWLALGFLLLSPWRFAPGWILLELPLLAAAAAWAASRIPALLRLTTTSRRRAREVTRAARAAFQEHAVGSTRGRTGLLVYVSLLERRVVVLPDAGIRGVVPDGTWNALRWGQGPDRAGFRTLEDILRGIDAIGRALASALPAAGENPDELADTPRIVS